MPRAHFEIYRSQVFELAKTLVFKSLATALTVNSELKLLGYPVNDEDYRSWKYYMNLAGLYHSFDTMMTVTSLDTLQTIEFTVDNLRIHRATAAAYKFGSRYYEELVSRYPVQEPLIQRILNPIDIDKAIAAPDACILWYQTELVESNESNFISKLQEYLNNVYSRWNVAAYQTTDELYVPAFLAMVYNFIPIAILNIRNGNCHTRYAHSFHIREFLTSHGKLTPFLDYLTKEQLLWLYRNIRYIHRNPGRQDTLDWMIDNLLTRRRIPISEWDMIHDLRDMPEQLYPHVLFERTAKNFGYHFAGADTKTIDKMLDDEQSLARGNVRVQQAAEEQIKALMETSGKNEYRTKVLESAILDLTDSAVFSFSDFILNHWLYLSNIGQYNSFVTYDDPRTGEATTISVKDAFTVFLFAINKQFGTILTQVPTIEADLVRRIPTPTAADIRPITEKDYLPDELLNKLIDLPAVGTHISIAGFRENMKECFEALLGQWRLWAGQNHYKVRGQGEIAGLHCYHDFPIDLSEGFDSYQEWFVAKGLPYWNYDTFECETLAATILEQATGANLDDGQSLREMQAALIRLMARLSSYTIQFLLEINQGSIKTLDWNPVRLGDIGNSSSAHFSASLVYADVMCVMAEAVALERISIYELGTEFTVAGKSYGSFDLELGATIKPDATCEVVHRASLIDLRIRGITEEFNDFNDDTPVRESEQYKSFEHLELEDAFIRLDTEQYTLTPDNRTTIELRWLEYLGSNPDETIDGRVPETVMDGVRFDIPELPELADRVPMRWMFGIEFP